MSERLGHTRSGIKIRAISILTIIALISFAVLASIPVKADPPGSPPYDYDQPIILTSSEEDHYTVGGIVATNVELSISISGGVSTSISVTTEKSDLAWAYLVGGIAAFFDSDTHEFIGAGSKVVKDRHSYDGIFCDHRIIEINSNTGYLHVETYTVGGHEYLHLWRPSEVTYKYEKTGIFCWDYEEQFTLSTYPELLINLDWI